MKLAGRLARRCLSGDLVQGKTEQFDASVPSVVDRVSAVLGDGSVDHALDVEPFVTAEANKRRDAYYAEEDARKAAFNAKWAETHGPKKDREAVRDAFCRLRRQGGFDVEWREKFAIWAVVVVAVIGVDHFDLWALAFTAHRLAFWAFVAWLPVSAVWDHFARKRGIVKDRALVADFNARYPDACSVGGGAVADVYSRIEEQRRDAA